MHAFLIIGIIVIILAVWIIITNNGLIRKRNKVEEARSGIEVALTKRYDMLTKLLDVAKNYARHEEKIFSTVIKLRQGMSLEEMQEADESMNQMTNSLAAMAEAYPQLSADTVFKELQVGIRDAEDQLQAARRVYNANVTSLNNAIEMFPSSIIAGMKKMTKNELYRAEAVHHSDVKMNF